MDETAWLPNAPQEVHLFNGLRSVRDVQFVSMTAQTGKRWTFCFFDGSGADR
jgi:hypothetical protein